MAPWAFLLRGDNICATVILRVLGHFESSCVAVVQGREDHLPYVSRVLSVGLEPVAYSTTREKSGLTVSFRLLPKTATRTAQT